jgi:Rieske Fe-S protein
MADPGGVGPGDRVTVRRRQFLGRGLLLVLAGFSRRVWAQAFAPRYSRLAQPVIVSLADLSTPWRARQFVADGVTLSSAATPNQPIRIAGMVLRTVAGDNQPEKFSAVCVRCPHEGCDCDFVSDPNSLAQDIKTEIGHSVDHSVYVCPCHNSTFKAEDGERIVGPAPRGLYRFRVTRVTDTAIEIGEVEEDKLIFV